MALTLAFTRHCLLLCVELDTSKYWSASIYSASINANHWTTNLSYVCQYHSKSLRDLSVSLSVTFVCRSTDNVNNLLKLEFLSRELHISLTLAVWSIIN